MTFAKTRVEPSQKWQIGLENSWSKMIPINGITAAILSILAFSIIQAENNVPVYMWNIDT